MKNMSQKNKTNRISTILSITWAAIIIASIYLFGRFANIYITDNNIINHEKTISNNRFITRIYATMAHSNSPILKYVDQKDDSDSSFFVKSTFGKMPLHSYATEYNEYQYLDYKYNGSQDEISATNLNMIKNNNNEYFNSEYFLTNGIHRKDIDYQRPVIPSPNPISDELEVDFIDGDLYLEDDDKKVDSKEVVSVMKSLDGTPFTFEQLKDINFLIRNFYIVDASTKIDERLFDSKVLLNKNMKLKQKNDKPQILIYHTHSLEGYSNSKKNQKDDTVIGVGKHLKSILENDYGYNVIHDTTGYDAISKVDGRNKAYNYSRVGVEKILKENPSIEVLIDLHRDSSAKRSTEIDGKEVAQIMLFNGLSRDLSGPITYLDNPNLSDNLAFGLQLQLKSLELYPGLFYKNYLKSYRYNLHLRPKSVLIELGTEKNTLESAKNAMKPFAKVLDEVLKGG